MQEKAIQQQTLLYTFYKLSTKQRTQGTVAPEYYSLILQKGLT